MNKKRIPFYIILGIVLTSFWLSSIDWITDLLYFLAILLAIANLFESTELWDKIIGNKFKRIRLFVGILLLDLLFVFGTLIPNSSFKTLLIISSFILFFLAHGLPLNPSFYFRRLQKNGG